MPDLNLESSSLRALIVDDNEINRQVMAAILDAFGIGHSAVEDGRAAVEAVQVGGYDVVLMDIQMPVMDGLEATRRIRDWEARGGQDRTPIVIVSSNCMPEDRVAGRAAGADEHLAKPVSVQKLMGVLQSNVEAARKAA
jgi:CheY-like chemotaxis protein